MPNRSLLYLTLAAQRYVVLGFAKQVRSRAFNEIALF